MSAETLPSWKKIWRDGFCPVLSTKALEGLRDALIRDDANLLQQCTTQPRP